MIIDTIISSLISDVQSAGYEATASPIDLFIKGNQVINEIVSITESDSDLSPFEAYNRYICSSNLDIVINVKTNDNEISLQKAHTIRDDVMEIIGTYSDYQIIIQRMTKENGETGTVRITLYCSVEYPIV